MNEQNVPVHARTGNSIISHANISLLYLSTELMKETSKLYLQSVYLSSDTDALENIFNLSANNDLQILDTCNTSSTTVNEKEMIVDLPQKVSSCCWVVSGWGGGCLTCTLRSIKDWVQQNNSYVCMIITLVLGINTRPVLG